MLLELNYDDLTYIPINLYRRFKPWKNGLHPRLLKNFIKVKRQMLINRWTKCLLSLVAQPPDDRSTESIYHRWASMISIPEDLIRYEICEFLLNENN